VSKSHQLFTAGCNTGSRFDRKHIRRFHYCAYRHTTNYKLHWKLYSYTKNKKGETLRYLIERYEVESRWEWFFFVLIFTVLKI
jgi:hypothetical protein